MAIVNDGGGSAPKKTVAKTNQPPQWWQYQQSHGSATQAKKKKESTAFQITPDGRGTGNSNMNAQRPEGVDMDRVREELIKLAEQNPLMGIDPNDPLKGMAAHIDKDGTQYVYMDNKWTSAPSNRTPTRPEVVASNKPPIPAWLKNLITPISQRPEYQIQPRPQTGFTNWINPNDNRPMNADTIAAVQNAQVNKSLSEDQALNELLGNADTVNPFVSPSSSMSLNETLGLSQDINPFIGNLQIVPSGYDVPQAGGGSGGFSTTYKKYSGNGGYSYPDYGGNGYDRGYIPAWMMGLFNWVHRG